MNLLLIFILIVSVISLILAHLGSFCIWPIVLILLFVIFKMKPKLPRFSTLFILPILIIAGLLYFQPYQYMDGGWDPGNYINTGVHIAKTGSVMYHDDTIKETGALILPDGTGVKYPGLFIKNANKRLITPQFFHLYPVWIAIFYKLFGLNAVFYVNPFFALLNICLLYLIGEKIRKGCGIWACLLLALNVPQIWNARFPMPEVLAQFFLLCGFYFWSEYLDKNNKSNAFWAGTSFGEFLLVEMTSLLIIPILALFLIYRHKKRDVYFVIPFFLLLIHLCVQLSIFSSVYFKYVVMFFQRKEIYLSSLLFILFSVIFIFKKRLIAFLVPILFIYGYFIWPHISGSIEARNLVELGNWISLIGLALAVLGLTIILYKEKNDWLILFAITALIFAVFFIYDKRMNTRYPFSLRRYLPVVIPAFCFFIAYLRKFSRSVSLLLIPLVIVIPIYRCKEIITIKDHYGFVKFWTKFANHIDKDSLYVTNRYAWARPLSDIFGKNVSIYKNYIEKGKAKYYITDSNMPYSLNVDFVEIYRQSYEDECIEQTKAFPPYKREQKIDLKIYKLEEIGSLNEKRYTIDIGEEDIGLIGGFDRPRRFSGIENTARWTLGEATLVIPWFGDNVEQILTIKTCGMPKKLGVTIISLYINDKPIIDNYEISEELKEHTFRIPAGKIKTNNKRVIFTIKSNTWNPNKYGIKGFPDGLGILIDHLSIEIPERNKLGYLLKSTSGQVFLHSSYNA